MPKITMSGDRLFAMARREGALVRQTRKTFTTFPRYLSMLCVVMVCFPIDISSRQAPIGTNHAIPHNARSHFIQEPLIHRVAGVRNMDGEKR